MEAMFDVVEMEELPVSDFDHIERLILSMYMAQPIFMKGASSSNYLCSSASIMLKNFDRFSRRSFVSHQLGTTPSFQDLLKNSNALRPDAGNRAITSFDAILDSLKLGPQKRPPRSPTPFLSPQAHSIFDKERDGKAEGSGKDKDSGMVLIRSYSYEDLGKRLGKLRPANMAKDGKEWFSLEELQGRIAKLAKLEEQDDKLGGSASELRKSILSIKNSKSTRVPPPMQMALLGGIGGQSMLDYMRLPPQEELLERYFHLDHMSSEEKMKLEL